MSALSLHSRHVAHAHCPLFPQADYLAVGYGSGAVELWSFEVADGAVHLGSTPAKTFIPNPDGDNVHGAAVGELIWPLQAPGVLLSAAPGSRRSLTLGAIDCATLSFTPKQTLLLAVGELDGSADFHCHLALSPDGGTLVVGNTIRSEAYILRVDPACCRFDWAAAVSVGAPMLSLAAVFPASVGGGASEEEGVRLFCQQSNAIAQSRIDLAICEPESGAGPAEAPATKEEEPAPSAPPAPPAALSVPEPDLTPKGPPSPSSLPVPHGGVGSGRFPPPPDTPVQPRTPPPAPAGESEGNIALPIAGLRLLSASSSFRDKSGENGSLGPASEGASTLHAAPKPHVSFSDARDSAPQPPKPHVSFSDELRSGGDQRSPHAPKPHVSFSDEKPAERLPNPPKPHVSFSDGTAPGKPSPADPAAASSSRQPGGTAAGPVIPEGSISRRLSGSGGGDSAVLSELQQMESRLLSALGAKARVACPAACLGCPMHRCQCTRCHQKSCSALLGTRQEWTLTALCSFAFAPRRPQIDALAMQQDQTAQRREQQASDKFVSVLTKQLPKLLEAAAKAQADAVAANAAARLAPALEKAVADAVKAAVDKMPAQLEKGVSAKARRHPGSHPPSLAPFATPCSGMGFALTDALFCFLLRPLLSPGCR